MVTPDGGAFDLAVDYYGQGNGLLLWSAISLP